MIIPTPSSPNATSEARPAHAPGLFHANAALEIGDRGVYRIEPVRCSRRHDDDVALCHLVRQPVLDRLASDHIGIGRFGRRRVEGAARDEGPRPLDDAVRLRTERMDDRVLWFAAAVSTTDDDSRRD